MSELRVLIVDDSPWIIDGIKSVLECNTHYTFIIHGALRGEEGIEKAKPGLYDIILMDYQLPDMSGDIATKRILGSGNKAKIIALSNYNEISFIMNMKNSGASGYVLKNTGEDELIKAMEMVLRNKEYYSNEVLALMDKRSINPQMDYKKYRITKREMEALKWRAVPYSLDEIAIKMGILPKAVNEYLRSLRKKLDVKSNEEMIRVAKAAGLLGQ
jgi:DNA-binding NarL/FixJ family response regulator